MSRLSWAYMETGIRGRVGGYAVASAPALEQMGCWRGERREGGGLIHDHREATRHDFCGGELGGCGLTDRPALSLKLGNVVDWEGS